MSKYTPGPWVCDLNPAWGKKVDIRKKGDFKSIAFVSNLKEADARLISAAPELLEALKAVISFYPYTHIDPSTPEGAAYHRAEAVIHKAEGGDA